MGWGGLEIADQPAGIFPVGSVPFDWLFPRVAAAVHHGGCGSTAAALRAGIPMIVIPFCGDQFFWGQRVAELGVGPTPIPRRRLTAARLAAAIQALTGDAGMRARAAALGERIRAEDGVTRAVEAFHRYLLHPSPAGPIASQVVSQQQEVTG
jgi:UDP:flavonoid glycosyltransferase YjiC (YdhE family)